MDNGLSFDTVQEPAVPEQSRLFIIIAIGLVGMLVLGLLGIGGYVVFARTKRATALHTQTNAVAFLPAATATIMVTNTPPPTVAVVAPAGVRATNTPVVVPPSPTAVVVGAQKLVVTTTPTRMVQATVPVVQGAEAAGGQEQPQNEPETPPETGIGFGVLGLGGGLAVLALLARRMRLSA